MIELILFSVVFVYLGVLFVGYKIVNKTGYYRNINKVEE